MEARLRTAVRAVVRHRLVVGVIAVVYALDQATKFAVSHTLELGESFPSEGFVRVTYVFNSGSAFGLFKGQNTPLIAASFLGILVLAWVYRSHPHPSALLRLSLGLQLAGWDLGFIHQSNGRNDPISRSWNRIMGRTALELGDVTLLLRAWWRVPEDEEDDDNPDIARYLGYGDLRAIWTPNRNTFTLMARPASQAISLSATWSYPITRYIRIYAEGWYGYGESMLDYDARSERISIGFALNDYLMRGEH